MLDNLTNRFSKVFKNIRGQAKLTEDNIKEALREVRLALLEADVALPVVKEFVNNVKEKALGQEVTGSLTPDQAFIGVVNQALIELMGKENSSLDLAAVPPAVVLMAGLQGAGKTTTVGKLARLLKNEQKKKSWSFQPTCTALPLSNSYAFWLSKSALTSSLPIPTKSLSKLLMLRLIMQKTLLRRLDGRYRGTLGNRRRDDE